MPPIPLNTLFRLRKSVGLGLVFAVAAFVAALVVRMAIGDRLPPGYPYLTFFPAVIITTVLAGLWPGIVTAVLSGLAAWYFFIEPLNSFEVTSSTALALGFYIVVVAVDITVIHIMNVALERLAEERNRSAALTQQAQVMFSELQHRVSNNLQLVSALMLIQQANVTDPAARRALEDACGRLTTLGRLHRTLHDPNRERTSLAEFLSSLCQDVLDSAGADRVRCPVSADALDIPANKMIPLALIVTELVSNALEHAFPGDCGGTIAVGLRADGDGAVLTVRDDGRGLPDGFSLDRPSSLGLKLVQALAGQLDGRFGMMDGGMTDGGMTDGGMAGGGTTATLWFPIPDV